MSRVVILNADDFGYEPHVTRGIVESMQRGLVSSTTFMVNTPWSVEAAPLARGLSVGLHLNLARFPAVSQPGLELVEAQAGALTAQFVEAETLAQVDRLEALLGVAPTHVDVHKHLHRNPRVLEGLARAAKARRLPVRSIDAGMRAALRAAGVATNDVFLGDAEGAAYWTLSEWEKVLRALPTEGVIELMCHPGYRMRELTSAYSAQREVELATLTSPEARAVAETCGVTFHPWKP